MNDIDIVLTFQIPKKSKSAKNYVSAHLRLELNFSLKIFETMNNLAHINYFNKYRSS